ncbi:MAG: hypothetical protein MRK01_01070 [Candidatus Scalindua sp.]|nr:hypothetical protein [Candidatus Scalindua sp.]
MDNSSSYFTEVSFSDGKGVVKEAYLPMLRSLQSSMKQAYRIGGQIRAAEKYSADRTTNSVCTSEDYGIFPDFLYETSAAWQRSEIQFL